MHYPFAPHLKPSSESCQDTWSSPAQPIKRCDVPIAIGAAEVVDMSHVTMGRWRLQLLWAASTAKTHHLTMLSWRLWATLGLQWATLCMVSDYPKCHTPSNHAKSSWRSHASHIQIHEIHLCPTSNQMAWTPTLLHQVLAKKVLPQHHCHGKQQSSTKASCAGGGGAGDHGGGVVFIKVSHFGWLVPSLLISCFTVLCPQVQKNGLASICANGWATKWNCLFLVPFI